MGGGEGYPGNATVLRGACREQAQFVSVVPGDTEDTRLRLLAEAGAIDHPSTLVLFTNESEAARGHGPAAAGPSCRAEDEKVSIDPGSFRELGGRFGDPGDFARAHGIVHEVERGVQKLPEVSEQARRLHGR